MHCLVINLDKSSERWAHMERMLKTQSLNTVHRISAVYGAELSEQDIGLTYNAQKNQQQYFLPLKKAEIACFMSHRKAWQFIVDHQLAFACILEDDVQFEAAPQILFDSLESLLKKTEPVAIRLFSKRPIRGRLIKYELPPPYRLVKPRLSPMGMPGFVINRAAAIQWLEQTQEIFEPIDVAIQRHWDMGFQTLELQPPLVKEISFALGGTTLHKQEAFSLISRVHKELARPIFRLKRQILSLANLNSKKHQRQD